MNLKDIHIGKMIETLVKEREIQLSRICKFFGCTEDIIGKMFQSKSLDTEILLRWSKLLEYDFFRIYSQHLILYAPHSVQVNKQETGVPQFRKNIYTKEIIDFILERIESGDMTNNEIIKKYRIPKTTLYKWISKYKK